LTDEVVYAQDIFSPFVERSPEEGRRYRCVVLAPGGTKDAGDILREFLGREVSDEAFRRLLIGAGG
jgi:Zn-dependent oligopeptidase